MHTSDFKAISGFKRHNRRLDYLATQNGIQRCHYSLYVKNKTQLIKVKIKNSKKQLVDTSKIKINWVIYMSFQTK